MKKIVLYISSAIIVTMLVCLLYLSYVYTVYVMSERVHATSNLQVGGITFEIADTEAKQELGLGGRSFIPNNYAMLFVFPSDENRGFWMRDMREPIDIIWLSDTGFIISIDANIATSTYPNVFYPPSPTRYVLETRAGFASTKNWSVGTNVPLPLPYEKNISH